MTAVCRRREDGCTRDGYEYWQDEDGEHQGDLVPGRVRVAFYRDDLEMLYALNARVSALERGQHDDDRYGLAERIAYAGSDVPDVPDSERVKPMPPLGRIRRFDSDEAEGPEEEAKPCHPTPTPAAVEAEERDSLVQDISRKVAAMMREAYDAGYAEGQAEQSVSEGESEQEQSKE